MNGCSRALTTFTLCPHLTKSEQSTPFCNMLFTHAGIRVHGGSGTWLGSDQQPAMCWNRLPSSRPHSCRVEGVPCSKCATRDQDTWAPLGHPDFVSAHLERTTAEHAVLLERIPLVPDVQSAWLLLVHCASGLGNVFAEVSFLGKLGRLFPHGVCSTPYVAIQLTLHLEGLLDTPHLSEVATIPVTLSGVGLEVPTWRELMLGAHAPPREPDDCEPGSQRAGGNMRLRLGLIAISAMMCCSLHCPVRRGLSSGLKLDLWMGWHKTC